MDSPYNGIECPEGNALGMVMFKFLKVLLTLALLTTIIPAALWVCGFVIFAGTISSMTEPIVIEPTDAIIVLTGGTNRVSRGLDLLAEEKAKDLLISGVHKDVKLKELIEIWGYKQSLPDCCITLGREAGNTIGNAIEAREWVRSNGASSVRLITANYHMPRALLEFRHTLPGVAIIPHPIIPHNFSAKHEEFWKLTFLEYHKVIMSFIRTTFFPFDTSPVPQALQ
jgi:uncharacterized SAM-binding protein YcdF (DUF218 family)